MKKTFLFLFLAGFLICLNSCSDLTSQYEMKTITIKNGGVLTFISDEHTPTDYDPSDYYYSSKGQFLNNVFVGDNIIITEVGPVSGIDDITVPTSDVWQYNVTLHNGYGYLLIPTTKKHGHRAFRMYVRFTETNGYYVEYQETALPDYVYF